MNSSDLYHGTLCNNIFLSWNFVNTFSLPVFLAVIVLALRSSSRSHTDVLTLHMAAVELVGVLGSGCCIYANIHIYYILFFAGRNLLFMATLGQSLFHLLVCLERYLAVLHPITYLHFKNSMVLIRNICIVCVWLFSFAMACLYYFRAQSLFALISVLTIGSSTLIVITVLCTCVLGALMRPAPGKRGGRWMSVDQSKRRAFYTMAVIMAALLLKFVGLFTSEVKVTDSMNCLIAASAQWFNIPSSLVLPLLLFHRRITQRNTTTKTPE